MEQQNQLDEFGGIAQLPPCEFMTSDLTWKVDELVSSTVEVISPTVDKLMQLFTESGCPPEQAFAVEMVLREALANAVIHGNRQDPHKKVRICCACDAKRGILIVVKDQGKGFDSSKIRSPLAGQPIDSEHGRGIYLMHLLADEVQFRHGGSEIYIRKDFQLPH